MRQIIGKFVGEIPVLAKSWHVFGRELNTRNPLQTHQCLWFTPSAWSRVGLVRISLQCGHHLIKGIEFERKDGSLLKRRSLANKYTPLAPSLVTLAEGTMVFDGPSITLFL